MKAKIKPRINLENRTKLEKVIPLSAPIILFIDPSSLCIFKCKICPTGHSNLVKERFNGVMNFDIYTKIIDDLKEFENPIKVLRLYGLGEPLLNKNFVNMVKYAKDTNYIQYIDTTTNGYFLTPDLGRKILDSGLDRINISVCGMSDKQFLEFTRTKVDFNKYVDNIKDFYEIRDEGGYNCEICIKTTGDFLTINNKEKFYETFGDYADKIFIENAVNCWPEFDIEKYSNIKISKTKGIYNQPINNNNEIKTCPYIFYSITINSDGSSSLCFLDWAHKLIIGDIRKQSLKEIWNGDVLYKYQMENLNGKRKDIPVCRQCGQLTHCLPDNIDSYADLITEKLLSRENARRKS